MLTNCALTTQGKLHQLIFEREQWQHVENHIHCFVHYSDNMENHPPFIRCAVKTHGKSNPQLFERGQWQHVENHIHCLVKQQWQHVENYIHCLQIVPWQHKGNSIHWFFKKSSDNMCKITYTSWFTTVTTWKTIRCLLSVQWNHMENQIQCFLRKGSDNMWKTTSTAYKLCLDSTRKITSTDFWKSSDNMCKITYTALFTTVTTWKTIRCLLSVQWNHMENQIHCFFEKGQWQHVESHIHCLVKQQWQHM